ncbi:MAG: acyl-CoA thioesterase [Paracoccaceae bacterium]|nr:acyl-CoA thioesterase [Paracoccaceae bacterium]
MTPFEHEISVTWGDCDPAKIVYTGNIPGYALSAINAFWEHVLDGDGWYQMELDWNVGTPFVHMSLDFRSPITPRAKLACSVRPIRLGNTTIEFEVIGRQDRLCNFEGRFVCVFTDATTFTKRTAPSAFLDVLRPYLVK